MDKGFTFQAIKHRKLTFFMIFVTLIAGVYSYVMLPRQESPDISVPAAQIFIVYPGASPAEMETYVTDVIEEELPEINGFDSSESITKSNMASIIVFLEDGVDKEAAWDELDDVMNDIEDELPEGVAKVIINDEIAETPGMIIGVTGEQYSYEELADYADDFKDQLSKIKGVSRFDVYGDIDKEIKVELDHELLNQYNLTLSSVITALNTANVTMPTGSIDNGASKIEVNIDAEYTSISDIENTVVLNIGEGRQVKLKDIGTVKYQNNPDDSRFSMNGTKAVYLAGFFEESLNVVMVGEAVEAEIDRMKESLPEDLNFTFMVYQPHDVEKSINDFMINLIEAVFFVIAVVFVGMGWRNAVVVSTVIPLSIGITMITMYLSGVKLEQMSISGLIIALGMLVDNAIVVSDAIQYHIDEGVENFKAAIAGTKEVAFSILTSTLTTIFAFLPLLLLDSTLGQFVYGVPYVVTVSLIASYVCALITTTVIAGITLRKTADKKKKEQSKLRKFFISLLKKSLTRKKTTVALSILFIMISGMCVRGLEATLLPKADKVMLQIDLLSEFASDINKTEELTQQAIELLKNEPELTDYYVSVGSNLPKFYLSVRYRADSPDIGQIAYTFDLSRSERFKSKEELQIFVQTILNQQLVGGTASTMLLELGSFSRPIEFKVIGDDLDRLDEIRYEMTSMMQKMDGVLNIEDDFSSREYQFYVDVDENKASYYGFTKYDIQSEATAAIMGIEASTFKKNGNEIPLIVTSDITKLEELENMGIRSSITGKRIRLKELADVQMVSAFPVINHQDGERSMMISADVAPGYSAKEIEAQIKEWVKTGDYQDVDFDFDGMLARIKESNMDLLQLGVFSLFMIVGVLILQFDSYRQPIVILVAIPLAFASALLGLFLTGQTLSFVAMLSLVALMGIVVNNAIVLLDCINALRSEGMDMEEACVAAVNRRYRPITLSTTTTVIGLIPLFVSGGELFRPLAITLISGLGLSMILTMVVVPTVYSMFLKNRKKDVKVMNLKALFQTSIIK